MTSQTIATGIRSGNDGGNCCWPISSSIGGDGGGLLNGGNGGSARTAAGGSNDTHNAKQTSPNHIRTVRCRSIMVSTKT